jgi:hypothetical protein
MKALINIYGFGGDMEIIPTVPRIFQFDVNQKNDFGVSLKALKRSGFDSLVYVDAASRSIYIPYFAGGNGNEVCIHVKKRHIFQKVKITSNVPILSYCEIGFFKSAIIVIKQLIKNQTNSAR